MDSISTFFNRFFGVAVRGQTYLNGIYLLLSFPLGLFYFVFLVTGIAVGVPLIIVWIGLALLMLVFTCWYGFIVFERKMAIWFLREEIAPIYAKDTSNMNLWQKFNATISNPVMWKGLVYLLLKFPLGTFTFVIQTTLVALSAVLLTAPFYYPFVHPMVDLDFGFMIFQPVWIINTLPKAMILSLVGIIVSILSMHILNGLAWVSGKFARVILGNNNQQTAASVAPVTPEPASTPERTTDL